MQTTFKIIAIPLILIAMFIGAAFLALITVTVFFIDFLTVVIYHDFDKDDVD